MHRGHSRPATAGGPRAEVSDPPQHRPTHTLPRIYTMTRLAALGSGGIKKPKDTAVAGRGCSVYHCISPYYLTPRGRRSGIVCIIRINIVLIFIAYYVFSHPAPDQPSLSRESTPEPCYFCRANGPLRCCLHYAACLTLSAPGTEELLWRQGLTARSESTEQKGEAQKEIDAIS